MQVISEKIPGIWLSKGGRAELSEGARNLQTTKDGAVKVMEYDRAEDEGQDHGGL